MLEVLVDGYPVAIALPPDRQGQFILFKEYIWGGFPQDACKVKEMED